MVDKCMLDLRSIIQNNKNDGKWHNFGGGLKMQNFQNHPVVRKPRESRKFCLHHRMFYKKVGEYTPNSFVPAFVVFEILGKNVEK